MALRPAGKTLSSLTGILVMAAVLWLLLNFVYAPTPLVSHRATRGGRNRRSNIV
jgi:hypothetical protein